MQDISLEEKNAAIEYYNGYFDEAGEERESQVIHELGSPEKVASSIKDDLKRSEKKEQYRIDDSIEENEETSYKKKGFLKKEDCTQKDRHWYIRIKEYFNKPKNTEFYIIVVLLTILCAPVLLGIFGMAIGVFFGLIGIIIGVVFAGIGLFIGGLGLILVSVIKLMTNPGLGLLGISGGLFFTTVGMLITFLMVKGTYYFKEVIRKNKNKWMVRKDGIKNEKVY